jgi:mono/diheme cytochrome c family protein
MTRLGLVRWLGGVAALTLAAVSPLSAQGPAGNLPAGEGRDILATACTQCHALNTVISMRDGPGGWKRQVRNMILRGAQVNDPDSEKLITYLVTNFGPGSARPPVANATPVSLPDGNGRELVEARCQLCHDLNRVAGIKRSATGWEGIVANMVTRGATATPEEARTIAAYLAGRFGE